MVRIADMIIPGYVSYIVGDENADIELIVPNEANLTQENINSIAMSDTLEEIATSYGETGEVVGVYHLLVWRSVTRVMNGYRFRWQTYRTTDINQLRQDNEDITEALLELAAIIGGGNG